MKKTLLLIKKGFESSTTRTPEYLEFHKTFTTEFTDLLHSIGATFVEVKHPSHFDVFGFFTDKYLQIWYFSISDLRIETNRIVVRRAKSYHDYVGENNNFVDFNDGLKEGIVKLIESHAPHS